MYALLTPPGRAGCGGEERTVGCEVMQVSHSTGKQGEWEPPGSSTITG